MRAAYMQKRVYGWRWITGGGMNGVKKAAESSFLCLWTVGDACLSPQLMQLINTHYQQELRRSIYMGLQKPVPFF